MSTEPVDTAALRAAGHAPIPTPDGWGCTNCGAWFTDEFVERAAVVLKCPAAAAADAG